MKDASEPTDIIWENRHFTDEEREENKFKIVWIILAMLLISTFIIFALKAIGMSITSKYPMVDCGLQQKQVGDDIFQSMAYKEYELYYEDDEEVKMTGALPCFCQQQMEKTGESWWKFMDDKWAQKED